MEPAPNLVMGTEQKTRRGSFKFVTPAPKHEGKRLNWLR